MKGKDCIDRSRAYEKESDRLARERQEAFDDARMRWTPDPAPGDIDYPTEDPAKVMSSLNPPRPKGKDLRCSSDPLARIDPGKREIAERHLQDGCTGHRFGEGGYKPAA